MNSLYLLSLNGLRYGIWKDQVEQVRPVETVHQLPFSPAFIAGLAVLNKQKTALVDLPLLIGLGPVNRSTIGYALLAAGKNKGTGFAVSGPIDEVSIADEAVFQMPLYLKTPVISKCFVYKQLPVPIIDLAALYDHVHSPEPPSSEPLFPIPEIQPDEPAVRQCINLFRSGDELFAMAGGGDEVQFADPGRLFPQPLTPPWVKGSMFQDGSVLPVIHLAKRMELPSSGSMGRLLTCAIHDARFGFLVDADLQPLHKPDFTMRSVPPLLESPWVSSFALHDGQVIPVIDPVAVLANHDKPVRGNDELASRYHPESNFKNEYRNEDAAVREFMLLGTRHAIPDLEIEDVLPFQACRWIPGEKSIIAGVVEHQGEIIPVLDLAMVFGRRSQFSPEWSLVLVRNGDFRAFVITPAVYPTRRLPLRIQKNVPVSLPQEFVYGCYPDGDAVRLIFNIEALAVHFSETVIKEFLLAMSKEMATAPEEIFPDLLLDDGSIFGPEVVSAGKDGSLLIRQVEETESTAVPEPATEEAVTGLGAMLEVAGGGEGNQLAPDDKTAPEITLDPEDGTGLDQEEAASAEVTESVEEEAPELLAIPGFTSGSAESSVHGEEAVLANEEPESAAEEVTTDLVAQGEVAVDEKTPLFDEEVTVSAVESGSTEDSAINLIAPQDETLEAEENPISGGEGAVVSVVGPESEEGVSTALMVVPEIAAGNGENRPGFEDGPPEVAVEAGEGLTLSDEEAASAEVTESVEEEEAPELLVIPGFTSGSAESSVHGEEAVLANEEPESAAEEIATELVSETEVAVNEETTPDEQEVAAGGGKNQPGFEDGAPEVVAEAEEELTLSDEEAASAEVTESVEEEEAPELLAIPGFTSGSAESSVQDEEEAVVATEEAGSGAAGAAADLVIESDAVAGEGTSGLGEEVDAAEVPGEELDSRGEAATGVVAIAEGAAESEESQLVSGQEARISAKENETVEEAAGDQSSEAEFEAGSEKGPLLNEKKTAAAVIEPETIDKEAAMDLAAMPEIASHSEEKTGSEEKSLAASEVAPWLAAIKLDESGAADLKKGNRISTVHHMEEEFKRFAAQKRSRRYDRKKKENRGIIFMMIALLLLLGLGGFYHMRPLLFNKQNGIIGAEKKKPGKDIGLSQEVQENKPAESQQMESSERPLESTGTEAATVAEKTDSPMQNYDKGEAVKAANLTTVSIEKKGVKAVDEIEAAKSLRLKEMVSPNQATDLTEKKAIKAADETEVAGGLQLKVTVSPDPTNVSADKKEVKAVDEIKAAGSGQSKEVVAPNPSNVNTEKKSVKAVNEIMATGSRQSKETVSPNLNIASNHKKAIEAVEEIKGAGSRQSKESVSPNLSTVNAEKKAVKAANETEVAEGQQAKETVSSDTVRDKTPRGYPVITPDKKKYIVMSPEKMYPDSQLYVVKKGDTLWDISKQFTGNPFNFPIVAKDNDIPNPNLIYPRQKLYLNKVERP